VEYFRQTGDPLSPAHQKSSGAREVDGKLEIKSGRKLKKFCTQVKSGGVGQPLLGVRGVLGNCLDPFSQKSLYHLARAFHQK